MFELKEFIRTVDLETNKPIHHDDQKKSFPVGVNQSFLDGIELDGEKTT